jgi:hypothetical protein
MSLGDPSKGVALLGCPYGVPVYRERCSIAGTFFYVSFRVSSRGALSPGSLADVSLKEMLLYLPLKVPGKGAPLRVTPIGTVVFKRHLD